MSQLIHVEVVKLWESEGSKVVYKVMMTMHLQAIFSFFNKSKGSYSEALSVAIKIVLQEKESRAFLDLLVVVLLWETTSSKVFVSQLSYLLPNNK